MAAPCTVVTNLSKQALLALLALGTPTVMLATATYTPNQDTLDFVNDVANEAAGTGYPAGGIILTGVAVNIDTATNKATLDADPIDAAGLSVSARWAVIYVDTGTPSTSPVIAYLDLSEGVGGNVTVTGIVWNAAGIVPFVAA